MTKKSSEINNYLFHFIDLEISTSRTLPPLQGYSKMPLVSFEEAVEPLRNLVPQVDHMEAVAKGHIESTNNELTIHESASIMFYTPKFGEPETSFYQILNTALRKEDRRSLKPSFLFVRLIFSALDRLLSIKSTFYRGVKGEHIDNTKSKNIIWWGFTSCTSKLGVLHSEDICGKIGIRTIFVIECFSGKNISRYSYFSDEHDVLLLPGTSLMIASALNLGNVVVQVQMNEIRPKYPNREVITPLLTSPVNMESAYPKTSIPCNGDQISTTTGQKVRVFEFIVTLNNSKTLKNRT